MARRTKNTTMQFGDTAGPGPVSGGLPTQAPPFPDPSGPPPDGQAPSPGDISPIAPDVSMMSDNDPGLITRFERMVMVPDYLERWYRQFQLDREYVGELAMMADTEDCVSTNYILRNQYVLLATLNANDPDISVQPRDLIDVPPPPPIMVPGPMGPMPVPAPFMPLPPGVISAPGVPPGPSAEMQSLALFGRTCGLVGKHFLDQAQAHRIFDGELQDTLSHGIAWIKINYQEDFQRDGLGMLRQDDQQLKFAQYRYLLEMYQASIFDENCPEYKELLDVSDTVKQYLTGQIEDDLAQNPPASPASMPVDPATGLPQMAPPDPRVLRLQSLQSIEPDGYVPLDEVPDAPRYRTFTLEQIMPEDVRYDWNVTRPEELHTGADWIAQRLFMTREALGRKFRLTPEELIQPLAYDDSGNAVGQARRQPRAGRGTEDPANRDDIEQTKNGDRCAVWEMQHKPSGRIYMWASGMKRFLRNYVPAVRPKNFYTIYPLVFNRVTGRLIGLSDVFLQQSLQDEINRTRTHELEARRACYPKIIVPFGLFSKGEKAKLEDAHPYAVIEMKNARKIKESIHEVQPPTIHAELYNTDKALQGLEVMAGIPQAAMGSSAGADSATESAITNQRMSEQSDRRKSLFEQHIWDIAKCILEMSIQVIDPETALSIAGQGGFWPHIDRDKLFEHLEIKIRAGSTGKPDMQKMNQTLTQLGSMIPQLAMCPVINLRGFLKQWVRSTGVYLDIDSIVQAPPPPPMGAPMPGAGPAGPGGPNPHGTPPGGHAPPGAGAPPPGTPHPGPPPMSGAPIRSPEQIPGSPATALAHGQNPHPM